MKLNKSNGNVYVIWGYKDYEEGCGHYVEKYWDNVTGQFTYYLRSGGIYSDTEELMSAIENARRAYICRKVRVRRMNEFAKQLDKI